MTDKIKPSSSSDQDKKHLPGNWSQRKKKKDTNSIDIPPPQKKKFKPKTKLFSKFETQAKKKLNFNSVC